MPAQTAGTWQLQKGELKLEQNYQMITGTYTLDGVTAAVEDGRLLGAQISFTIGGAKYSGRVKGDTMSGGGWNATRVPR